MLGSLPQAAAQAQPSLSRQRLQDTRREAAYGWYEPSPRVQMSRIPVASLASYLEPGAPEDTRGGLLCCRLVLQIPTRPWPSGACDCPARSCMAVHMWAAREEYQHQSYRHACPTSTGADAAGGQVSDVRGELDRPEEDVVRLGPAQAGGNLTNGLISRQIRTPSRADVADVRPCLPVQVA